MEERMVSTVGQGLPQRKLGLIAPLANKMQRDGQSKTSLAHEALQFVPDLFIGAGEGAWDMVSGMADMVLHPIRTAKGICYLATHLVTQPTSTLRLLGHALVDPYVQAWESGHPGQAIGMGVVEIGSLFITPGEVASVARGGAAFSMAAVNGLRAGEGVGAALHGATLSADFAMKATSAARAAERLAQLGHAAESERMAIYAKDALRISKLAEGARSDATFAHLMDRIAPTATINVAGTAMTYGDFLAYTKKLVGWGGLARLTGRVPKGVYSTAADANQAAIATKVAEQVLADGSKRPNLMARLGRMAMRNPQFIGPLTPAIGLVPQTLGRLGALPTNLPKTGLTPATAATIASRYNLEDTLSNVQAFIDEVSGYQGATIGPDTANPQQVKELQALLQLAGYSVEVSGTWDTATSNAVISFKRDNGIHQTYRLANGQYAVNEYADSATLNLLINKANDPSLTQSASATLKTQLTAAPATQH